jgi:hypothetical protein
MTMTEDASLELQYKLEVALHIIEKQQEQIEELENRILELNEYTDYADDGLFADL